MVFRHRLRARLETQAVVRSGAEASVVFRSAKERGFRGAKDDNATLIDSPIVSGCPKRPPGF
jgi:hypothetical protein